MKNEKFRLRLKGKVEKYKNVTDNDYYFTEASLQYKATKVNDWSLGVFKLVYNNIPLVSNDTSSNNSGFKVSTNFNTEYDSKTSSIISFTGAFKNYPVLARKDKIINALFGLEHIYRTILTISPDFSFNLSNSSDDYYKNYSYGPSLFLSLVPTADWEHFLSLSYFYTKYSSRKVSTTVRGRLVENPEYQSLTTIEVGTIYSFTRNLTIQGKYANTNNNSNNSTSAYRANIFGANIGLRF